MLTVLKVRIYPNTKQEVALEKNFGCCRLVFNCYLNKPNIQYQETGKGMSYCQMAKDLTQLKKSPNYEWLREATAATLQQALKNLETAFNNFFAQSNNRKKAIKEVAKVHGEFQACGEDIRLVNTCIKKQSSVSQESSVTASA